jgi:hypothetical protein
MATTYRDEELEQDIEASQRRDWIKRYVLMGHPVEKHCFEDSVHCPSVGVQRLLATFS